MRCGGVRREGVWIVAGGGGGRRYVQVGYGCGEEDGFVLMGIGGC